jgi:hypothetical protein
MKHLAPRSTSINRRMLLHSRASTRRSLWKSRYANRRNSLSISSLLHRSQFNSNLCNSLNSRYSNRSSLFMCSLRRNLRQRLLRTLSLNLLLKRPLWLKNRSVKKPLSS